MSTIERSNIANDSTIDDFAKSSANLCISPAPEVLYHYCSFETFSKIHANKALWSTHILDMRNDRSEFLHGMELFSGGIDKLVTVGMDPTLGSSLKKFIKKEAREPKVAPYILCLTPNKDQQSQWQEYGERGTGLSLGFKSEFFCEPNNVLYAEKDKHDLVCKIVDRFHSLVQALHKQGKDLGCDSYVRALADAYFRVAYVQSVRFKESKWSHENEWRAVAIVHQKNLEIFTTRSGWCRKARRIKITFDQSHPEIVMGPSFDSTLQRQLTSLSPGSTTSKSRC